MKIFKYIIHICTILVLGVPNTKGSTEIARVENGKIIAFNRKNLLTKAF
jgi:hypothetical protein